MPTIKDTRKPATIIASLKRELKEANDSSKRGWDRARDVENRLRTLEPQARALVLAVERFERVDQLFKELERTLAAIRAEQKSRDERLTAVEKFIAEQALGMRPLVPDSIIENAR